MKAQGFHLPTWAMLTFVAAAGLLAGYALSVAEHLSGGQSGSAAALFRVATAKQDTESNYTVTNTGAWSKSLWDERCRAAPEPGQQGSGIQQLCRLPSIWKNCSKGVYLDIGTNVGVQIRKLFDAHQFPNAPVLPVFDKVFGSGRAGVCAIGVEANPHHTKYLQTLNTYFDQQGYQAIILTEVAASTRSGNASFFLDPGSPVEWGASLTSSSGQPNNNGTLKATVALLDLPAFVVDIVRPILKHELQATGSMPPVAMKLDVEGEEYSLVPALMVNGGLCDCSVVFLELHPFDRVQNNTGVPNMPMPEMEAAFAKLRVASPGCRVQISHLDDETFLDGKAIALPPLRNITTG